MSEEYREINGRVSEIEKEIIQIKADIKSTNKRVDNVENVLTEINDNTKWIKRAFIKAGISILVTILGSAIIGLIVFYLKSLGG